ncbi:hypothetical protein HNO53_12890 [Billgrantia antri]|uniref:Uncharacterized protein n=1 Tax=Halomonas sulfidivorans TaxID=2733488 RepID=A0ABX7WIU8_9GAMM|nr:hypothetical protein [Halomonas sulfidivorans]QTP59532.1 hypothetical protein HNO53_12890 [Halomonas sulfidivorans]
MELLEWFYDIDYSSPVSERYEYKTDIIEAWDGTEQRIALLDEPDHTLFNNYVLHKSDWLEARNKINGHREGGFLVPNRNLHFILRDVVKGSTYLTVPPWAFKEGGWLLLKDNEGRRTVHSVSTVGSSGVYLSGPVQADMNWCECVRLDVFYLSTDLELRVLAGDFVQVTVPFKADEESFKMPLAGSDVEFFDGLPVMDFKHNFAEPIDHREFYDDVGAGWGTTVKDRINRAAGLDMRMTFDLAGPEIQRFKAFAHEVRGRQGSFWVSDHSSAFYMHSIGSGNQINVEKSRLGELAYVPHKVVEVITESGVFRRKVVDVMPASTYDILVLNESIPDEAHSLLIDIRFLHVARFLNDVFEYDFYHDQYARISKSLRSVRSWQPA